MKKLPILAMMFFAAGAFGVCPAMAETCLVNNDVKSTNSPDGNVLLFHMKDGTVWRNTLQAPCPDLKFNGYVWVLNGVENICENQQTLQVLHSGETCILGKFTKLTSAKKG